MNKNYLKLFLTALIALPLVLWSIHTLLGGEEVLGLCFSMFWLVTVIVTAVATFAPTDIKMDKVSLVPGILKNLQVAIIIIAVISLFPFGEFKTVYNTSVVLTNDYIQKTQERSGFYDAMYKTYSQKKEIAFISQAQFTAIATLIMENKKDGAALTWKWLSEQKIIPFEEFTSFWKDLSSFIEGQRKGYFELEKECQKLANQHNILLKTFPNKVYNWILQRDHLQYKYGFTSDSTVKVFQTGIENLPDSTK